LSDKDISRVFKSFDLDGSGELNYDEYLRFMRGPMNALRKRLVMQAFDKIDRDRSGQVEIDDVRDIYNASRHPDVMQGKKTEDDILMEFLETFEVHHSARENSAPDHIVTKAEFIEYYENISASCDND
jgi:Ca2+-binding EF-hand superfamily protein